jgi:hypothetical protein
MCRRNVVEKNETHILQYNFSLSLMVFEIIELNFYAMSSCNSRTIGLILIIFNILGLCSSSPLFCAICKRASKVGIQDLEI